MEEVRKFEYNGSEITFQLGNGDVMVNATEMAKPFGKNVWKWLELPSTKAYIEALSENRSLAENQLITSVRGGNNPDLRGNWIHEDLALEFAQWLSVDFKLWCNDRVKELMKYGFTATENTLEDMIANPDLVIGLATQLKQERAERQRLAEENRKNKPLVDFANTVAGASDAISMGEFAKVVYDQSKMGRNKLFQWLREQKILDKKNHPYQRYIDNGWFSVQEQTYTTPYGNGINLKTLVTGKGQISIIERVKAECQ